ncbi:SDR family oxidoreductase [Rhodococcus rhodnii]|nr:SDR family oxidoreductase [Rhodococcus rhodnii]
MDGLETRIAVVTGAAGAIGRATAALLAKHGATVAVWDREEVTDVPDGGLALTVDVTDPAAVAAAWGRTEAELGTPTILVHAAGVLRTGSALDDDHTAWHECLAVNATGTMIVASEAARRFVAAGGGAIVVVSSNAAASPRTSMAAYGASKAAATSFVRSLGLEVARHGVRCNIVSPGSTDTAMLRGMWSDPSDAEGVVAGDAEQFRLGIPLRRIADPEDIANAAVYLVSDAARHVTMHDLRVDGGATLDM